MKKNISKFQYLTQDLPNFSHLEMVEKACNLGTKWIQLRAKNKSFDGYLELAKKINQICKKSNTKLIINDSVEIAKEINADGVHLGKNDMPIDQARERLGKEFIIGGTCNTYDDIKEIGDKVDYIGLGPYHYTQTKENLSPILKTEEISNILSKAKLNFPNLPIVLIGGIKLSDLNQIKEMGAYGAAVSSAVNLSSNFEESILNFNDFFKE